MAAKKDFFPVYFPVRLNTQPETGSTETASTTTHSREIGGFRESAKWRAYGWLLRRRFGLRGDYFRL
jgi:hypothetical protein